MKAEGGANVTADDAISDDAAVKTLTSAGAGARVIRVELSHQLGLDRAKLSIFDTAAAS